VCHSSRAARSSGGAARHDPRPAGGETAVDRTDTTIESPAPAPDRRGDRLRVDAHPPPGARLSGAAWGRREGGRQPKGAVMGRAARIAQVLLRIVAGVLFLQHGGQKPLGWFGGMMPGGAGALPPLMKVAGVLELVGGTLIVLGLFTRPVALLLCGEMAVAYFTAHAPHGALPILNHGEPPVLFCFIFLFLAASGPGGFSLDAAMSRVRTRPG
jgi:putative oxidoreductase